MISFKSLGLAEPLYKSIKAVGYEHPTPIQASAIPIACEGKDLIGCAQTGTGKTAAFVLPVLDRLLQHKRKKGPAPARSLIIAPTRELAIQITDSIRTYGRHTRLSVLAIFGGVDIQKQIRSLRRGPDILVATPGRLLDHMQRGTVKLSRIEILILDEADRMLDMGFIHDIRKIVAETPKNRQTMLFSATMPAKVEALAQQILNNPELIEIGRRRNPAKSVAQHVCFVKQTDKTELLVHILNNDSVENMIVFSRTKHRADRICRRLVRQGFAATVIHSNRSQGQRQKALEGLQKGRFNILVATNIAARGIDLDNVSHVINYDTPQEAENYIHRIGRTGRGDATGKAITFVGEDEARYLRDIEKHTGKRIDKLEYEGLTLIKGQHQVHKSKSNEGAKNAHGASKKKRTKRPSRPGKQRKSKLKSQVSNLASGNS